MRRFLSVILLTALLINCTSKHSNDSAFADAQWIALEELDNSMKVVPGVHGSGDNLGEKCVKRSIVPMFRKEFNETGDVESASVNICGLGHYELYINGRKAGDRFLSPGWSNYQKRIFYNSYDITDLLIKGDMKLLQKVNL